MNIITIAMVVAIGVLLVLVILLSRAWYNTNDALGQSKLDYFALERGSDELADGFHQERLSFEETIEAQAATIVRLDHDLKILHVVAEHHSDNCIPEFAPVLGHSEYLTLSEHSENPDKYVDRLAEYVMEPHLG